MRKSGKIIQFAPLIQHRYISIDTVRAYMNKHGTNLNYLDVYNTLQSNFHSYSGDLQYLLNPILASVQMLI